MKYFIGTLAGGVFGYFVLYKMIGCSSGACPITASPYISTIYGVILGALFAGMIVTPQKSNTSDNTSKASTEQYRRITAQEAKARMDSGDKIIILDVRTKSEYDENHIQNAILIPNETITDKMPELLTDLDAEILVYCRSGNRSEQAARKLISMGYTNIYDFGGIIDWPYDTVNGS